MATLTEGRITRNRAVCGGRVCIAGHRVRVLDVVVWHEHQGMSPDEIVTQVPSLTLADVHAALAYYFDHMEEIQEEMRAERSEAEEFRRTHPWGALSSASVFPPHRGRHSRTVPM